MLLTIISMVSGSVAYAANTVTWDASSKNPMPAFDVNSDLTLTWDEGSATNTPGYTTQSNKTVVSMASGSKVTVAGADANVTITKIVFTYVGDNLGLTPSVGSSSNSFGDNTSTWTGEANSITFTAGGRRYVKSIEITYTGSADPVVKAPVLAITQDNIADTYDMDANGVFVVYYENQGNLAAENAKLTLYVDGVENASKTIGTLNTGTSSQNFWNAKYNVAAIETGEHQVYLSLTADNADEVKTDAKTVTFTKAAPVPAFSISAAAVTVPYDATSYDVVATLTETNNAAAENVKVELRKGISEVLATQTVATLAAGGNTQVTLTVAKESFETGEKTYYLYVNDKYLSSVTVTFEEAPVVDVKDLAITEVLGTIKLGEDANTIRVTVQNNGNVNITDAPVVVKAGDKTLGEGTVSAAVGQSGWTQVSVNKEGLEAGTLEVTATVTVDGDATPADNTKTATITVEAAPVPEATFSVTANNVNVAYGAEYFEIRATVKNTSEVDATNVEVKLLKGITEVATTTIEALAAGVEQPVVFQVESTAEDPFVAGKTVNYFVQVANQAQAEVEVTFANAPEEKVVDINLVGITGLENINLQAENTVMVTFQNNSTVDELNATITLKMNGTQVGEAQTIAKGESSKSFTLPTEGLVAGETATLVATLAAENNKEGNTVELTKELSIVSGEAEPAPALSLSDISGWEVEEAGVQTISVSPVVYNTGDADAENVIVKVYKEFGTDLATKTINVEKGSNEFATLTFEYDIQQATTFHVVAYIGTTPATETKDFTVSVKQQLADLTIAKIADIEATPEEEVKATVTIKNNSSIAAEDARVALFQGTEQVDVTKTVSEIEANGEAQVEFTIGVLPVGTYNFNVQITSADANADNNTQTFVVKVSEPVAPVVNVGITTLHGISNIDLAESADNTVSVWYNNEGNVNAEGTVSLTLNGTAVGEEQAVEVAAGQNGFVQFTLPTDGLVAGEQATVVATLTIDENISEAATFTRVYDIVDSSVATEPTFAITAEDITVAYGEATFSLEAQVTNTSTVDATDVKVYPFFNVALEEEATTFNLKAGATKPVAFTLAVPANAAGKTLTYYVIAPKAQAAVNVTFEAAPVVETTDVALTTIQGISNIDLAEGANNTVSVWAVNNGNTNADVQFALTLNGAAVGEAQTVSIAAERNGYASFTLPIEGLAVGEIATVVATITVDGNQSEATTLTREYNIINSDIATEATYSIQAENVEAYLGDAITVKMNVKNTSNVDAANVEVKIVYGLNTIATKTIETLAAGAETEVAFDIPAVGVSTIATAAGTYELQAIVADKASDYFTITLKEKVTEVVDLAITAISGTLSLNVETNYVTVFVQNNGTVDVADAAVTLKNGETVLGNATVNVKAGQTTFCSISVPATALTVGEFEVTATVTAEWDADLSNNTMTKTYTIAAPEADLTLSANSVAVDEGIKLTVTLTNNSEWEANDVVVKLYTENSVLLGEETIATIAGNSSESVDFVLGSEYEGQKVQVWTKATGVKWITIDTTVGIHNINAMIENGSKIYTIDGQKVNSVSKAGLYIIDGKKMMVK
jgi:hypothetical protein